MNKKELLKLVGSVEQIGGVRDFTFNDGKAKGVRAIEINTGKLRFTVLPDRCMDIADAYYEGTAVAWISRTGIVAPQFYEKDGMNWLRSFTGGLLTTCGLKNIGGPVNDQGLHGRIANVPSAKVSVFADWVGDEYIMQVSGEMRECAVFGENLVLKRTITAKLFDESFTVEDCIVNESFEEEGIALCYHCNYGYPLVREGAKIINVPSEIADIPAPIHGKEEECIDIPGEKEGLFTAGIENGEIGAYITHNRSELSDFLVWKMPGESEYVVGLEPRTVSLGGQDIIDQKKFVMLKPFEEMNVHLRFDFKKLK